MHVHPHSTLPFVQLESPTATGDPKVPMVAACASGEFALAPDDEASPPALVKRLLGGQIQIEFEHVPTLIVSDLAADRP
jgi:hypothetical protein